MPGQCQGPQDWDALRAEEERTQTTIDPSLYFGCEVDQGNQAAIEDNGMASCPSTLTADQDTPEGWRDYVGDPDVFHCGYRGILEDITPSPERLMNECFYDDAGNLVDEDHPWAECGGTPDAYPASDWFSHTFLDPGGIMAEGWDAFWASRSHDAANRPSPGVAGDGRIDSVRDPDNPGLVKPWEPKF